MRIIPIWRRPTPFCHNQGWSGQAGGKVDLKEFNESIIKEFRENNGVVGGDFEGAPMLILTTTGAKTGLTRENPLVFTRDGDRYIIIASYAGAPNNPPWYYNLVANPEVGVEIGSERFTARAEVLGEPERSQRYERMAELMPAFHDYAKSTSRKIPVIALTRMD
ncbi:MAG: nitroreductase family deazaflavin-dependent oxidoreductase [Pseudomonadales bacterium]|nr:nitroreductase family deazaflavin-dependent oxidoreductase [Pseudomonadales bacterium]